MCVISDSGTITEESSILRFPAITIRNAHERPEGMDETIIVMSGLKPEHVLDSVNLVINQKARSPNFPSPVVDYETSEVSKKIVRIVYSYVDYVNRYQWRKFI